MIILDTNVLSALMIEPAAIQVATWLNEQPRESMWTTSITVLEIHVGLETMAGGRRRDSRLRSFRRLIEEKLEQRIAAFDHDAAEATAMLMAARSRAGTPRDLRDTMIAGIAVARRAAVATRNVRHFSDAGIDVINPWNEV